MSAHSHFSGKKPAAGRQNSAFPAKPPVPAQKKTHSWKRPSGQTGLSARRAVFSAGFSGKSDLEASQALGVKPKKLPKGTRQGRPAAAFSKGTLPAKKANTYCLRRAKGKQKSLWPAANQRHDRRKNPCRSAPAGVLFYAVFARRRVMSPAPLRANPQGRITRTA